MSRLASSSGPNVAAMGKSPAHGGESGGRPVRLDFSVNMNPLAEPLPREIADAARKGLAQIGRYPELTQRRLREAIGAYEGVDPETVLCGNGASELIMAVVHALSPRHALLAVPCFSGYARALRAVGCEIHSYALKPESGFVLDEAFLAAISEDTDLVFLATPNNPTGRLIEDRLLREIEDRCRKAGAVMVTDACFLGLSGPPGSDVAAMGSPPAAKAGQRRVVINAFTKLMSVPGVRLGYLICQDEKLYRALAAQLPEWNISTVAQEVGIAAAKLLAETDFRERSLALIGEERRYLTEELRKLGLEVWESDTNFLLIKTSDRICAGMLDRGILVRDASNFEGLGPGYIRIAVKKHGENRQLIRALREEIEHTGRFKYV